jgi:isopenicillin N synthase-like dioxygenase
VPWGGSPFVLTEPNCFPSRSLYPARHRLESLYAELSSLASTLLALLASSLGRNPAAFTAIMRNSISTLRLLHYPSPPQDVSSSSSGEGEGEGGGIQKQILSCTPHTDSGLLTLLHQDATGGLEVRNASGEWIPAPYVPGSMVVNVGDLLARMSGGRLVATEHRVRSSGRARYSVPFFCEPGVDAVIDTVPVTSAADGSVTTTTRDKRYEEFVLEKMGTWVEFQDAMEEAEIVSAVSVVSSTGSSVAVY